MTARGSSADLRAADFAPPGPALKSAEDHYTQGVALMNLGRWDEAREHLDRARKAAPKADHIVYAMAALDCLTGEADSAMQNLKIAIQLRPENRYHARNDEDFAFLQEDPRFTELLYPSEKVRPADSYRSSREENSGNVGHRRCALSRLAAARDFPSVLRGLKEHIAEPGRRGPSSPIADLAAVVTVTDDGGSSGRLRREYRVLPPGDIRNCMVALSKDEHLLGELFQYRFPAGRGLAATVSAIFFYGADKHHGRFPKAVRVSAQVLAIRGRIFPRRRRT